MGRESVHGFFPHFIRNLLGSIPYEEYNKKVSVDPENRLLMGGVSRGHGEGGNRRSFFHA